MGGGSYYQVAKKIYAVILFMCEIKLKIWVHLVYVFVEGIRINALCVIYHENVIYIPCIDYAFSVK